MKTIKIKSLALQNFKGIRKLSVDFNEETTIYGANGTGKTTLFDAFTWLLFGKDSTGRTDFEIKTLDENNKVIEKIDHSVEGVMTIDGEEVKFKRTLREKWVKKRGAMEPTFSGNETLYEWNDVEMTKGSYETKINEIIDENVFKLITNPKAFNELKWQEQRQTLMKISGGLTDAEIAKGNKDFEALLGKLTNKTLEEYTKQVKSSRRKSNKEIESLPARIDEVQNSKPAPTDYSKVKDHAKEIESKIEQVDEQIADKNKEQEAEMKRQSEIRLAIQISQHEIKSIKSDIDLEVRKKYEKANENADRAQRQIQTKKTEVSDYEEGLSRLKRQKSNIQSSIETVDGDITELRDRWHNENSKEFSMDNSDTACPTCKRPFEADKVEEMTAEAEQHFNDHKQKALSKINKKGKELKAEKEEAAAAIEKLDKRVSDGEKAIKNAKDELDRLQKEQSTLGDSIPLSDIQAEVEKEYQEKIDGLNSKIKGLEAQLNETKGADTSSLKDKKAELNKELDQLKSTLSEEKQIERANKRIEELSAQEKTLAQNISQFEKELHTIEQFTKAKIDHLENEINQQFDLVSFKLFETQINGAEKETCKALIGGVPFSDANTASKVNAGLDIINTLSEHYGITAPIFIDNRESVIELIECESQLINLFVSAADKELTVAEKEQEVEFEKA